MTDYSLWEVILNGDSPAPTRVIEGVVQPVGHTFVEQKLARRNKLKAHGTLLMALPDKHQLKFNSHKDAKTLMEAIEKHVNLKFLCSLPSEWKTHTLIWRNKAGLEEQSLNDLFNSLKIYETEVKHSSSTSTATQNLAFMSSSNTDSTTNSVSAAASVSAVYAKIPVSCLPNVDSLSNAINVDDLEEMDLRWQMAMLTMRARRECRSPKDSRRPGAPELQRRTAPVETSTSNALVSNVMVSQPSGGYHVILPPYIGTFMPPKPDLVFHTAHTAVETDHLAFNVQSTEQVKPPRHSVQPVETSIPTATPKPTSLKSNSSGKRRNRKTCFVFKSVDHLIKDYDYHAKTKAQPTHRNYAHRGNHKQYASLTHKKPQKHMVPTVVLTQSKPVFNTAVRPVSAVVPKIIMTRPRLAHQIVTKSKSPIRRHITRSPSPKTSNSPPRVTAAQAPVGTCPIYLTLRSLMVDMLHLEVTSMVVRFLEKERLRQNYNGDAAFDGKEHDFDAKKPESEVTLSPSSSAQSKKQDDKTKKEAKGKKLDDITHSDDDNNVGAEADFNNLETSITLFDNDFHTCMFACFLLQEEPKRVHQALKDLSWIEAMQEELLQFKMQKVWVLVDLPHRKRAIGTKLVYKNKKDERGIVIRNKVRLVTQGHTQEEGIDYEEVFALVARIKVIRLFLAYASFMGFMVYQVKQKKDGIFISQDKYVAEILRKFGLTEEKSASTPIDTEKPLLKDLDGKGFSGVETPLFKGLIVGQVIEEGGDAEEHVQEVTDDDTAQGDDTAAYGEVPIVSQKPSIPSLTLPTPPPQPP
nr:putative ribonuclease H-like domain-containing protein [Tanacetum cinerariifolium]